jgi:hypothetical protein
MLGELTSGFGCGVNVMRYYESKKKNTLVNPFPAISIIRSAKWRPASAVSIPHVPFSAVLL